MMIKIILTGVFTIVGTILGWTLNGIRENFYRKVKLCFQIQITENQNELTSLEYRTKTSESGFGLEIYNIGQTPIFIEYKVILQKNKYCRLLYDRIKNDAI